MNIISLYNNLKDSYKSYLLSFVTIKDKRIEEYVNDSIQSEEIWPKALIQFNQIFAKGIGVPEMIANGLPILSDLELFFSTSFYKHQQKLKSNELRLYGEYHAKRLVLEAWHNFGFDN